MVADNRRNLLYFESSSMNGLYHAMQEWQSEHNKRFLSISTQIDDGKFCCIGLTNPTEVVITNDDGRDFAEVDRGQLRVSAEMAYTGQ